MGGREAEEGGGKKKGGEGILDGISFLIPWFEVFFGAIFSSENPGVVEHVLM